MPFDLGSLKTCPRCSTVCLANEQFKQVLAYLYPQVPFEMIAKKLKACKTNLEFQLAFAYDFVTRSA